MSWQGCISFEETREFVSEQENEIRGLVTSILPGAEVCQFRGYKPPINVRVRFDDKSMWDANRDKLEAELRRTVSSTVTVSDAINSDNYTVLPWGPGS